MTLGWKPRCGEANASAAQSANDVPTAISAYQRFLNVAPDNPNAAAVKQTLAQLEASVGQAQG